MRRTANKEHVQGLAATLSLLQVNVEHPEMPSVMNVVTEAAIFQRNAPEKLQGLKNCTFTPQAVRALMKLFSRDSVIIP